MTTCLHIYVFFSDYRPPEELDNKGSSTRRGEFDSSTPEAIGGLLGQVFLAYSFWSSEQSKPLPIKKWE